MKTNLTPEAVMIELNRLKTDTRPTTDFDRRSAALERAKRAVRKTEIKMKPEVVLAADNTLSTRCPVCDCEFTLLYNFCFNCGQALDWD